MHIIGKIKTTLIQLTLRHLLLCVLDVRVCVIVGWGGERDGN